MEKEQMLADRSAFVCDHVIKKKSPILYVSNGAFISKWMFSCGMSHYDNVVSMPLTDAFGLDSSLDELRDLPDGHIATRKDENSPWEIK